MVPGRRGRVARDETGGAYSLSVTGLHRMTGGFVLLETLRIFRLF